jgi:hypothetical protein
MTEGHDKSKICDRTTNKSWQVKDIVLKLARDVLGLSESLPKHARADYQFSFCFDTSSGYSYRGQVL